MTLYHYATPKDSKGRLMPHLETFEARSGTEAVRLKDDILRQREHRIRIHARHVVGWSKAETKRRRKEVLHQISWLHANVEEVTI
jgi:hypothetical protein